MRYIRLSLVVGIPGLLQGRCGCGKKGRTSWGGDDIASQACAATVHVVPSTTTPLQRPPPPPPPLQHHQHHLGGGTTVLLICLYGPTAVNGLDCMTSYCTGIWLDVWGTWTDSEWTCCTASATTRQPGEAYCICSHKTVRPSMVVFGLKKYGIAHGYKDGLVSTLKVWWDLDHFTETGVVGGWVHLVWGWIWVGLNAWVFVGFKFRDWQGWFMYVWPLF